jgi:hypothetical protein
VKGLLTSSALKTYRECPKKYELMYDQRWRPVRTSGALRFGTLTHKALEAWWKNLQGDRLGAALEALRTESDPWDAVKVRELIVGYEAKWGPSAGDYEAIGVETKFTLPLMNPDTMGESRTWDLGGKMDVLVRALRGPYAGCVGVVEHKCLCSTSRLYDHRTGTYRTVAELVKAGCGATVTAMNAVGHMVVTPALAPVAAGIRPIWTIATLGGRSLRVSGNHPVMTQRGWVEAELVNTSDWVATPRSMKSTAKGSDLSDEAVRLIGYMIGDGCLGGKQVSFTKTDPTVLADVVRCAAALGEAAKVAICKGRRAPYIRFSTVGPVSRLMDRIGLRGVLSAGKTFPSHLGLSDRQLGQIVGSLWSTDGCIDGKAGKVRIIYTSVSRALCEGLRDALQRLGIVSNVQTTSVEYRGSRRAVSTTQVVSRRSRRDFLRLAVDGVIPVLRSARPLAEALAAVPGSLQGNDERMQPHLSDEIWWDKVESVSVGAEEKVYDITVPGVHTFVVDGVVTHNTSSEDIESDASPYFLKLTLDGQISQYYLGGMALGHDVEFCVYDVLKKPTIKQLSATPADQRKYRKDTGALYANQRTADETPEEYGTRLRELIAENPNRFFRRHLVMRTDAQMKEFLGEAWDQGRSIRDGQLAGRAPKNPDACFRYGMCAFWSHCSSGVELEHSPDFYQIPDPHAELKEETVQA